MTRTARRPAFADLPAGTQAALLFKDSRFQRFAAQQCGYSVSFFTEDVTSAWLRDQCNILSRADLHSDVQALVRFNILITEFDVWTGKIAAPR
ncbi:hypothetical protein [Pseudooceanicola spongiae]|uniref:Uncharacterized protein n=1 Tax=Pseudooceanicola spongiae TaxID=2613965 RepID=A0A7L9WSE6_9RHOB|nr:hypothetical protein [Pseudooceanicola spongiae]QOL82794.1 hypothetical protein F3W81_19365 [Pseudooceanicola spongiae]